MSRADGVEVRAAEEADIAGVLDLWSVARSPIATTEDDATALRHLLDHGSATLLVARLDDLIVGTAIAAWDGWRGHIHRLAVLPAYRRQGIGRRLIDAGHERLRGWGAERVNAAVGAGEPDPIAFWIALGYRRDSGVTRYAKNL